MKRYVIYQRVSTDEQAEQGYSLDAMYERCVFFIKSQDAELIRVFQDNGFSGRLPPGKRPALNELLSCVKDKSNQFDSVLVWRLDRLSRSLRDTVNIEYILRKNNIALESVSEKIDTSTAAGAMFFNTVANFAEFESAQIGERTWNAMSHKVGEVYLGGRPPYGYRRSGNTLEVYPEEAEIVKKVYSYYLRNKTYMGTARYLNQKGIPSPSGGQWSHMQVKFMLQNPVYIGHTVWNRKSRKLVRFKDKRKWIIERDTHLPIISERVFNKVRSMVGPKARAPEI